MTSLTIKNMVCNRCVMVLQQQLERLHLTAKQIDLGHVELDEDLTAEQFDALDNALESVGFERIDDRKVRLIESIKNSIRKVIHQTDEINLKFNWSSLLSEELHYDYSYLSNLFSSVEGITIEHYIIHQKIERAKELLLYDELTLSQIAVKLDYSSVAHLSAQFKKITGMTPSEMKKTRTLERSRKPIDSV